MTTETILLLMVVLLFSFVLYLTWVVHRLERIRDERFEEIARLKRALESSTPPENCLREVSNVWQRPDSDSEHLVLVRFYTIAGMTDFHRWLRGKAKDANLRERAEALKNGRGQRGPASSATSK